MAITTELETILNARYGRDVRQAIHDGIKQAYDDGTANGNANMEVSQARGSYPTLGQRLNESDVKQRQTTAQLAQTESKKVDKNGVGQIKYTNFDQETKEMLANSAENGFPVVGPNSVGTENIINRAVTLDKLSGFDDVIIPKTLSKDTGDYMTDVAVTNNALKGWALPFKVADFNGKITKVSAYLSIPSASIIEFGIANRLNSASNILVTKTKTLESSGKVEFDIEFETEDIIGVDGKFFLWFKNVSGTGLMFSKANQKDYPTLNNNEFYYWSGTQWDASTNFATYGIADIKIYTDYTFGYAKTAHTHDVSDIIGLEDTSNVKISFPENYDLVVGDAFELFWKGILLSNDPYRYNFKVTCEKGNVYKRKFRFTPTAADIGTHKFTLEVYDDQQRLLDTKSVNLVVRKKATSPTVQKNVLCLGDSLMSGGTWVNELHRRLTASGGMPAGDNLSNVKFVGTKTTKEGVGYEGAGGWTYGNYTTNTATDSIKWVNVTSHDKTTSDESSLYEDGNGTQWSIETIEINRIKMVRESTSGILPTSGTLTWVSGGDNHTNINYNSITAESGNPFWNENTSKVDFVNYASEQGVSGIDICYVLLGWNMTNLNEATFKQNARSFIDKLRADYPSCKISLLGLQVPSLDGIGANYGTSWNYYEKLQFVFNLNNWYKDISEEYIDVDVINIAGQFDTDYNMQTTTRAVNTRNSTLETYQNNGVHPAEEGYLQIADAVYRNIAGKL